MRYELTDNEGAAVRPLLPNKPPAVPRVDGRRVRDGIFWVLRSGASWRDLRRAHHLANLADIAELFRQLV
jgi:transposase